MAPADLKTAWAGCGQCRGSVGKAETVWVQGCTGTEMKVVHVHTPIPASI